MKPVDLSAITIDTLPASLHQQQLTIDVLRLDKIHSLISGNKWFKLHNYLEKFRAEGKKRLVTYGGPWSNHLIATAALTHLEKIPSLGLIRGERPSHLSQVLLEAGSLGMELLFLDRDTYRAGMLPPSIDPNQDLIVPQGGYGKEGMTGAMKILDYCDPSHYSHICCAVGTGTMMAGLIKAAAASQEVMGFSVMKNNFELLPAVEKLLQGKAPHARIDHDHHFGGYAKYDQSLLDFMNDLYRKTGIPTDIVYTSKLVYGVLSRAKRGYFPKGGRILLIHSGGLTGNSSLKNGTLIF